MHLHFHLASRPFTKNSEKAKNEPSFFFYSRTDFAKGGTVRKAICGLVSQRCSFLDGGAIEGMNVFPESSAFCFMVTHQPRCKKLRCFATLMLLLLRDAVTLKFASLELVGRVEVWRSIATSFCPSESKREGIRGKWRTSHLPRSSTHSHTRPKAFRN